MAANVYLPPYLHIYKTIIVAATRTANRLDCLLIYIVSQAIFSASTGFLLLFNWKDGFGTTTLRAYTSQTVQFAPPAGFQKHITKIDKLLYYYVCFVKPGCNAETSFGLLIGPCPVPCVQIVQRCMNLKGSLYSISIHVHLL